MRTASGPQSCPLDVLKSPFYSRISPGVTRSTLLTVRKWLSTQSYEAQREFGLLAMENVRKGIWR
jgi:hypothetical protein